MQKLSYILYPVTGSSFPEAVGLYYRDANKFMITVPIMNGTFVTPDGGWESHTFIIKKGMVI